MAPTKVTETAKKANARKRPASRNLENPLPTDLARLVGDVRTALDELAVRGDLATMEGRDRIKEQVAEVEKRWWRVKQELGVAKSEADDTIETLRSAFSKAEEAVRHLVDATFEGFRNR